MCCPNLTINAQHIYSRAYFMFLALNITVLYSKLESIDLLIFKL